MYRSRLSKINLFCAERFLWLDNFVLKCAQKCHKKGKQFYKAEKLAIFTDSRLKIQILRHFRFFACSMPVAFINSVSFWAGQKEDCMDAAPVRLLRLRREGKGWLGRWEQR